MLLLLQRIFVVVEEDFWNESNHAYYIQKSCIAQEQSTFSGYFTLDVY